MTINRGLFSKALWEGMQAWYGDQYNQFNTEYDKQFTVTRSKKAFEEDILISGLALATLKTEGSSVSYQDMSQGWVSRYTHLTYATGFVITDEMVDDDLYNVVGEKRSRHIARAMRQTRENVAANVFNRGFNSTYTGGDGIELFSTVHLNKAGGTFQNALTTASDISEAALEQAYIDIGKWTDDAGLRMNADPVSLHIPVDLVFETERILNAVLRVGTSDNDPNAIRSMGKFSKGAYVNHYFSDVDAWFIKTDVADGLKFIERRDDTFTQDNDFDTDNLKYKATARYSAGWSDPKGGYGSPGA